MLDALALRGEDGGTDANPVSRPTYVLQGFLIEIVFVNSLDLMTNSGTHADTVHDQQTRQFFPVNQNDALRTPCHILLSGTREALCGDKYPLGRARSINRTGKIAQIAFAYCIAVGISLRLDINFV